MQIVDEFHESDELGDLLPSLCGEPPGPKSLELMRRLKAVEIPCASTIKAGTSPIFWEATRGANVVDVDGNIYIDLTGGFCVAVAGHSNPRVAAAIGDQARRMMHNQGGINPTEVRVQLAEKLAEISPGELTHSYVSSTGAEAIDMAIKTACLYTGRHAVVAFSGGFHGKTLGVLGVTAEGYYRDPFLGHIGGFHHLPFPNRYRCPFGRDEEECCTACADYLEHVLATPDSGYSNVAAILLEPIQGHGGWIVPPRGFVRRVRELCDQHGILMIADEVITGFGRTGMMWGCEHFGVVPDILVSAKGLASGFPISAVLTTGEIANAWGAMQHTSTFLSNPMGCAAALASIAEIEERGLAGRATRLGARFKSGLEGLQIHHQSIGDVRGLGLMLAIEFVEERATKRPAAETCTRVVNACIARGIMATNQGGPFHNVLKMSPPLVISERQVDYAVDALDQSIAEAEATM